MNRTDGEDLAAVDQALRELPKIDPPPALVRRTLDGVAASQARAKRSRHLGAMALALAVVVLTVGVALLLPRSSDLAEGQLALGPATPPASTATEGRYAGSEGQTGDKITGALEQAPPTEPEVVRGWRQPAEERNQPVDGNVPAADDDGQDEGAARLPYAGGVDIPSQELDGFDWRGPAGGEGRDGNNVKVPDDWADKSVSGLLDAEAKEGETGEVLLDGKRSITLDAQTIVAQPGYFATEIAVGDLGKAGKIDLVTRLPAGGQVTQDDRAQGEDGDDEQMRQALARLSSTDEEVAGRTSAIPPDLRFIPARGWFANTYIPGDGDVARLDLGRVTRKLGGLPTGTQPALEAVRGVAQPFDRPVGQALSLQLAADRTAVEGPTRLTLQIGLAGAAPVKARRAPIATALVIDVASASDEVERQTLWSLADALVAERQPGDAFTIVVPRAAGPTLLGGEALSAGELARTLAAAAEERQALEPGVIEAAYRAVGEARAAAAAP
ncbi:MAG: hypothetical protein IT385_03745, partial [Deltaproteobacteria bacterium]|nr:hypothetical protein [Deltaproteobacteria bacterium]